MSTLRSAVIRLAHMNPSLRGALLPILRSAYYDGDGTDYDRSSFDVFKARDGKWYGSLSPCIVIEETEYEYGTDGECSDEIMVDDYWGPFPTSAEALKYLQHQFPHYKGDHSVDAKGTRSAPGRAHTPPLHAPRTASSNHSND